MGRAWAALMTRLGYTRYVAQGGDWGAFVVDQMGLQAPPGLLAIHTNMPAIVPADVDKALLAGEPAPPGLSADERRAYEALVQNLQASRLRQADGLASADPVRHRGFTSRPGAWLLDHNDADGQPAATIAAALTRTPAPRVS